jgi:hypothetical protein
MSRLKRSLTPLEMTGVFVFLMEGMRGLRPHIPSINHEQIVIPNEMKCSEESLLLCNKVNALTFRLPIKQMLCETLFTLWALC